MEWVDKFLADCRREALSPRTITMYSERLKVLQTTHGLDFEKCSQDDVNAAIDVLLKKSPSYAAGMVGMIKRALVYLGREELAKKIKPIRIKDREKRIRDKILKPEEIKKLIVGAESLQDRLMIEIFTETGCRLGELYNLRIKDVGFDEHSAILSLSGKSGTRMRRVYFAVPDLRSQLNNHTLRNDPDARLFCFGFHGATKFNLNTVYSRVRRLGLKVLKKKIYPHMFRHTKATEDTRLFNDRELMLLFGWTNPGMVGVYSHLTMRDVDDKDLVLHGKKRKEEILRPIVQIQRCESCGAENAPIAIYCSKCGQVLTSAIDEKTEKLESHAAELEAKVQLFQNTAVEALKRLDSLDAIVERIKKLEGEKKKSV